MMIISNNGSVQWYVGGVLAGQSTDGPTAVSALEANTIRMYITNGADESNNVVLIHALKVYVKQ